MKSVGEMTFMFSEKSHQESFLNCLNRSFSSSLQFSMMSAFKESTMISCFWACFEAY